MRSRGPQAARARRAGQQPPADALAPAEDGPGGEGEAPLDPGMAALVATALADDPEAAAQLKRYEAAVVALERARARQAELEELFRGAAGDIAREQALNAAEARQAADTILADAELVAAEKLLAAAELGAATAASQQAGLAASLESDADRVESIKAGAAAAVGGAAATLPFALLSTTPGVGALLSLGATLASCVLFGVVFRYAVRTDEGNGQLKSGVVGAFGLVRALAAADALLASAGGQLSVDLAGNAALLAGQSMLTFAFAAGAVEAAMRAGQVRRKGA